MELSSNIKFYRKAMNLTQEELANMLNGKKALFLITKTDTLLQISKPLLN